MTCHGPNLMPPPGARVAIAMSGGVDSAAAAALMVNRGHDCLGITLRLTGDSEIAPVFEPCCGLEAARDAQRICEKLGIPHRTLRVVETFDRTIIENFAAQYARGQTPNPCIRCNRIIKFGLLFRQAREWGCDFVALGHYARLSMLDGRIALRRAAYLPKDQSYVLAPLTQAQLQRACFPLGDMSKDEARAAAARLDPRVGGKADSQEICFVADRDYARIVEARRGAGAPGFIRDVEGRVLGRHQGIHRYTIGQRRGLGVSAERPLYVVHIDPEANVIVVGRDEQSLCRTFKTGPIFWGGLAPSDQPFQALVQLRYRHHPIAGTIVPRARDAQVTLDDPQRAVTPGQWAVYYDAQDRVLAASKINRAPISR